MVIKVENMTRVISNTHLTILKKILILGGPI
jgi:hypothetical protein